MVVCWRLGLKKPKHNILFLRCFRGGLISNYEHHRRGRIWIVWTDNVRLTPIFKSDQLITVSVLLEGKTEEFLCTFVYASNFIDEKKKLWKDLRDHHDSPMFRNKPWMIGGDFNEILHGDEHSNYVDSLILTSGMTYFQHTVLACSILDLGYQGSHFTWCNKRDEGLICKKLDRLLVNERWMDDYPQSYCVFEAVGFQIMSRDGSLWMQGSR